MGCRKCEPAESLCATDNYTCDGGDSYMKDCDGCGKEFCDSCYTVCHCMEHQYCDDWDCVNEVTWDCERGGCELQGNCRECYENCSSCDRPPGTDGVY
jgi:hypothetical protein